MKIIKTTIAIVSLAIGSALFATGVHAAPDGEFREAALSKLKALKEDLALTENQQGRIRTIVKAHKASIKAQWTRGKAARTAMKQATLDHGAESAEAKEAASRLGEVARDRSLLIAKIAEEVRPVLSEEQIRKLTKVRAEFETLVDSKLDSME